MPLTDEQSATARALWLEERSAGAIAAQFGVTRNAIIGYVARWRAAGLLPTTPRLRGRRQNQSSPQAEPDGPLAALAEMAIAAPAPAKRKPAPLLPPPPEVRGAVASILALRPHHCRWPMGDADTPDFRFCCAPIALRHKSQPPYCQAHLRRAIGDQNALRRFGVEP